jgi:hypothetical protein
MRVDQLDPGHRVAWTCLSDFLMRPRRWVGTTVTLDPTRGGSGVEVLLRHGNWPDGIPQAKLANTA